jgi:hypothetical protein
MDNKGSKCDNQSMVVIVEPIIDRRFYKFHFLQVLVHQSATKGNFSSPFVRRTRQKTAEIVTLITQNSEISLYFLQEKQK